MRAKEKDSGVNLSLFIKRHRASFPQSSIIAAAGLNFCVRNENRCFPSAMGTELTVFTSVTTVVLDVHAVHVIRF